MSIESARRLIAEAHAANDPQDALLRAELAQAEALVEVADRLAKLLRVGGGVIERSHE